MSDSEDYEFGREVIENEGVDEEFRNAILNAKKSLNNNIIDGPELYNTQDLNVLNDYIKSLNNLYILSIDAQKGVNVKNVIELALAAQEKNHFQTCKTRMNKIRPNFSNTKRYEQIVLHVS